MPPSNEAAWLYSKATLLEIKPAPYTSPGEHEIVIRNRALAINPVDWFQQAFEHFPMTYPVILGHDTAGTVEEVGKLVTRFKVGDRVVGNGCGMDSKRNSEGAFQQYTVVPDNVASHIPSTVSFEAAAVIPLGFSTAACALYQKDHLALHYPSVHPKATGQVLLVWGGSTSVGSNAIQLGVASGYEVLATSSPRNFDYVRKLGATQVFDYSSKTVVAELVEALRGKVVVGALDAITQNGAIQLCAEVLSKCKVSDSLVSTVLDAEFVGATNLPDNVKSKFIWAETLRHNKVGSVVYEDYLHKALEAGTFISAPDCEVVGSGLEAIQIGLDALRKGVSAKKIVITL